MKPALITSVDPRGVQAALSNWPNRDIACDIYAFLRNDPLLDDCSLWSMSPLNYVERYVVEFLPLRVSKSLNSIKLQVDWHLKRGFRIAERKASSMVSPDVSVCAWLATRAGNDSYISQLAKSIARDLSGKTCIAFSTFIPEVTSTGAKGEMGVYSLLFILKLIRELNRRFGCKIRIIEMVCGSLIDNIRWSKIPHPLESNYVFEACRATRTELFQRLLKAVSFLIREIDEEIVFALELEPGPLYLLHDLEDLKQLNSLILLDPKLDRVVGFNCDVMHWTLAGMESDAAIPDSCSPFSRIVHAHLSDSGIGHFGDLAPMQIRTEEFFLSWLRLIRSAYSFSANQRRASGFVSLEMEMCEGPETVKTAANVFCDLLRRLDR